jgi:cytochrome c biogenesis protein
MCPPSDSDAPLDGVTPHTEAQDDAAARAAIASDPLRPSDHIDGDGDNLVPSSGNGALGVVGWLRWFWRQLTSMRIAILLLLLLAIAAVPGSLFSQTTSDPNGVIDYKRTHPELYPILKAMGMFDVYSSGWFSAIYILLFISLIGCVLPRTKHHWQALRARPPRTPVRLQRLE